MGSGISTAGAAAGSIAKGTGGTIGGIFKLLFLVKWRWTITIFILSLMLWGAIAESIQERNFKPLIFDVGGQLVSADENFYWYLKGIEANDWKIPSERIDSDEDGFWRDIKSLLAKFNLFFQIFSTGWFLYIVFYALYFIFNKFISISWVANATVALIIMILLQVGYAGHMLYLNYDCPDVPESCLTQDEKYTKSVFALTPLKGVGFMIVNFPNVITAFKESATPVLEIPINETNVTASL